MHPLSSEKQDLGERNLPLRALSFLKSYEWKAPLYDAVWKYTFSKHHEIRREAIERLELKRGEVVLDVGCGTGLNFVALSEKIGPQGHIYAFDNSPAMLRKAEAVVRKNKLANVSVIQTDAKRFGSSCLADAALFYYVPDILSSRAAVENIFAQLKPRARVVAVGPQCLTKSRILNSLVRVRHWLFIKDTSALSSPYSHVLGYLENYRVESRISDTDYILCGLWRGTY